ncbi:MAG: AmmeMemoRadiSam system radical SAM enzyme [Treponema sp.]|nr:AmmeMemoRadiSam system radical SAM enzyme [Treponema sp.]
MIPGGAFGACGVRGNKNGKGLLPYYGHVTALAVDPIEKKPLYHFRPGSAILSAGFAGCNLRCPFCQNWHISQPSGFKTGLSGRIMQGGDLVSAALHEDSRAIAYTYSEPLVHVEFLLHCMALARRHGIANVLVTNGCVNSEAAQEILRLTDAANIDLKCFSAETYARVLGAAGESDSDNSIFNSVLAFIRLACSMNVHVEITTLVVPGLNDSADELDKCADFIASLSGNTGGCPWHLSAYHPDYRWNAPPTDPALLLRSAKRAREKLRFVYTGNTGEENNTKCRHCGTVLVRRRGYRIDTSALAAPVDGDGFYRCAHCGGKTHLVYG